eukprot:scaffold63843_cov65-Phaeocystis_antarctica.AAC.1
MCAATSNKHDGELVPRARLCAYELASAAKDDDTLVVAGGRLRRPVERAVEQRAAVDDGELMMEGVEGRVEPHGDTRLAQSLRIGARALGLPTVSEHAHATAAPVRSEERVGQAVVRQREHGDVERASRGLKFRAEPRHVCATRAACLREEEHLRGLGGGHADGQDGRWRRRGGRRRGRRHGVEGDPQPLKLGGEAGGEAGAAREDEVFVVAARGAAAPIEGAVRLVRGRVRAR